MTTTSHPETKKSTISVRTRIFLAASVLAILVATAATVTSDFSLTGRPTYELILLFVVANILFVGFVVTLHGYSWALRSFIGLTGILLQLALLLCFRTDGLYGNGRPKFAWRWSPSSLERQYQDDAPMKDAASLNFEFDPMAKAIWSGFRGHDRTGLIDNASIESFESNSPRVVWKQSVGSGWSSFAIADPVCITQEQRGENESVVCYDLKTGAQLWEHRNSVRFGESTAGYGPRATPTIDQELVFAFGATGILDCLRVATGELVWSRDVLVDSGTENRNFGMTGSPLVRDDRVVVAPGGKESSLICFKRSTGDVIWANGNDTASYSSPQHAKVCGIPMALCLNGDGLSAHRFADGQQQLHIRWTNNDVEKNNVCQPVVWQVESDKTRILLSSGYGRGTAVFEITKTDETWSVFEVWRTKRLKSKFSSVIVRDGYVYGLDHGILTCLSLEDGTRMWKKGRYGYGQLIGCGNKLIVQAEKGHVAQVKCDAAQFVELARVDALLDRTWNHPAYDGNYLLVRNDKEAICFEVIARFEKNIDLQNERNQSE